MFGFHLEFMDHSQPYFKRCGSSDEVMRELRKWEQRYKIAGTHTRMGIYFGIATAII